MSAAHIKTLIRYRLEQAEQALNEACLLRRSGAFLGLRNRAYYAMFYAVLALLAMRGQETSKHREAISFFDREFVKSGRFAKEFSQWLHEAFEVRLEADYTPFSTLSAEEADELIGHASSFVSGVKIYLETFLATSEDNGR